LVKVKHRVFRIDGKLLEFYYVDGKDLKEQLMDCEIVKRLRARVSSEKRLGKLESSGFTDCEVMDCFVEDMNRGSGPSKSGENGGKSKDRRLANRRDKDRWPDWR
jgi:hypothetical protein